jgi:hypothetical protein
MGPEPRPVEERFWQYVSPCPNTGCWWWEGTVMSTGYGQIRVRNGLNSHKMVKAAHVSLMLHGRPRPSVDALACHHCDQPNCVNPEHLYWGTLSTNAFDAYERGRKEVPAVFLADAALRGARTHCQSGHEFTPENTLRDKSGMRVCRECGRTRAREYQRARRRKGNAL